jgi:uncharacterized protein (DUF433 family)
MQAVITSHIRLDDRGVAWIDDTNIKVIEVVVDKLAHGSSPEEMAYQYPHLSLAQIHAALSYYYDHEADFNAQIEQDLREVDEMAAQAAETSILKRLRTIGKIP